MSSNDPTRLRGSAPRRSGPYLLGQLPDAVLFSIGRQIVHRLGIGQSDLTGDDFGTIFANAISGTHRTRPLGVADVSWDACAWSIKTVKDARPFNKKNVRLISGRNSPDYSLGISNPRENLAATGRAVLSVWNARINEALDEYNELRIVVLIRNMETREFLIFEEEARQFIPTDYEWSLNPKRNLVGYDRSEGQQRFTWQPHGSQFTVHRPVPGSARRFSIVPNVPVVSVDDVLAAIRFRPDWIRLHG